MWSIVGGAYPPWPPSFIYFGASLHLRHFSPIPPVRDHLHVTHALDHLHVTHALDINLCPLLTSKKIERISMKNAKVMAIYGKLNVITNAATQQAQIPMLYKPYNV